MPPRKCGWSGAAWSGYTAEQEADLPWRSALHDVHRQAAPGRLLVLGEHVGAGLAHGLDDLVQAHEVRTVAMQRHARRVDRLDRGDGVALDARDLHQPADRVAGQPQVVLHADLGRVLRLGRRAAQRRAQRTRRHRARHAHLTLAADFRPADGRVLLVEDADRPGREQEVHHAAIAGTGRRVHVVVQHGRHDAGGAVGRGGDHAAAGGVFLVDGQRPEVHPVEHPQRVFRTGIERSQPLRQAGGAPLHLEPSGQQALGAAAALDAGLHGAPDGEQAGVDLRIGAPVPLVGAHHASDVQAVRGREAQQVGRVAEGQRQHRRVGRHHLVPRSVRRHRLAHHEAAAHGVVGGLVQQFPGRRVRREAQPVGMEGQGLEGVEAQVAPLVEGDRMVAGQRQAPTRADVGHVAAGAVHVHGVGLVPREAQQHGGIAAVALARGAQRAVELRLHAARGGEQALVLQGVGEQPGGTHGAHRVGAGRTDADLEEVEDADGHGAECNAADGRTA